MKYWGKHLLVEARTKDIASIVDRENISKFVAELVIKIDMVPYGPLWIEHFATHDPEKAGISFIQMIETSNISGHFVDKDGTFYLDVFSCKDFEVSDVLELIYEYFGEPEVFVRTIIRDANKVFDDKVLDVTE